jgi:hypothetical protein
MDTAIDGIIAFSAILVAFGVFAVFGGIVEYLLNLIETRRRNRRRRELLPGPNVRSQRRGRQWQVPL